MKNLKAIVLFIFLSGLLQSPLMAKTYTAIKSGYWDESSTWANLDIPSATDYSDTIVVLKGVTVNADVGDIALGSKAVLEVDGTLLNPGYRLGLAPGTVTGTGTIATDWLEIEYPSTIPFTGKMIINYLWDIYNDNILYCNLEIKDSMLVQNHTLSLSKGDTLTLDSNATCILSGGKLNMNGALASTSVYNIEYKDVSNQTGPELTWNGLQDLSCWMPTGDTVTFMSDVTVHRYFYTHNGSIFNFGGKNFTLLGQVNGMWGANVISDSLSTVKLNCNTYSPVAINFVGKANKVKNLVVDMKPGIYAVIKGKLDIKDTLNLKSGILTLDTTTLVLRGDIAGGGHGMLQPYGISTLVINTKGSPSGGLNIFRAIAGNVIVNIQNGGNIRLYGLNTLYGRLQLVKGKIFLGSTWLYLMDTSTIIGGDTSAYIVPDSFAHIVKTFYKNTGKALFPIGTARDYYPLTIQVDSIFSNTASVEVGMYPHVFENANDTTTRNSKPNVGATWFVSPGLSMDLTFGWEGTNSIKGFDTGHCYVSNYYPKWDSLGANSAKRGSDSLYYITRKTYNTVSYGQPFTVFSARKKVGIPKQYDPENKISIYPNPVTDILTFDLPVTEAEILDVNGRIIASYNFPISSRSVSVADLSPGAYLIHLKNHDLVYYSRFVKE